MDWIKKNKDWLITLAVFIVFVMLLTLIRIFSTGDKEPPPQPVVEEEATFELPDSEQKHSAGTGESGENGGNGAPLGSTSFFLRPDPSELLKKLEGLDYRTFRREAKKLPGIKVMWPAYFFSIVTVKDQKAQVMFDASEDGFGVVLMTEIDTTVYPQILVIDRGTKIWLAAEISGVDTTGTGQFMLTTEYVRFDDYQPPKKADPPPEKSQ